MTIFLSNWRRLSELWDLSEMVNVISEFLLYLTLIKSVDLKLLEKIMSIDDLKNKSKKCLLLLRHINKELENWHELKLVEHPLVTLIIDAMGNISYEKIRDALVRAMTTLNDLNKIQSIDEVKRIKSIDFVMNFLRKLMDALMDRTTSLARELNVL